MSDLEESAKAVAEVAKCVTTTVEKASDATGFIAKYIDEPLSVLCGKWVDNKKFDRWENQLKIFDKVNAHLKRRGCKTLRLLPPKLGIPLIDNALLEDDDDLRELWCKLIANSLDSTRNFELKYVYIDIIKSLTPLDVRVLKYIHESINNELSNKVGVINLNDFHVEYNEICKEFPVAGWYINVSLRNLMRVQCIEDRGLFEAINDGKVDIKSLMVTHTYTTTTLGRDFIYSCMTD